MAKENVDNKINKKEEPVIIAKPHPVEKWRTDKGDKTHRLDYDLNTDSIVFDVGGYLGTWTSAMFLKYGCDMFVFEPIKSFYDVLNNIFCMNSKVKTFNLGLSGKKEVVNLYKDGDSTSRYKKKPSSETVHFTGVNQFFAENKINHIDLMKINIEGGEYDLLKSMIKTGLHKKIKNLQIQFHRSPEDFFAQKDFIYKELGKTHAQTYCYDFVWENWKLKNVSE